MSPDADRIAIPTNGKGPRPNREPAPEPVPDTPEPADTSLAFTPTQLAVGFGILASLVVLLVGWMRRRGGSAPRGPFGRR